MAVTRAKYPRRTIALGQPYDDGSYFEDGVRRSLPVKGNADAITAVIKSIRHRLAIMAGPGVVGLPREKEWGAAFDEMRDELQMVLDAIEEGSVQSASVPDEAALTKRADAAAEYYEAVIAYLDPENQYTHSRQHAMDEAEQALAAALGRSGSGGGRG